MNMRKEWTPAEIEQLRQLAAAAASARVIARTLGRTVAAVQSRATPVASRKHFEALRNVGS